MIKKVLSVFMIEVLAFLCACGKPAPPKSGITIQKVEKGFADLSSDSWYFKPIETDSGYKFDHVDGFLTISGTSDKEKDVNMIQMAVSSVSEGAVKIMADSKEFYSVVKTIQTTGAGSLNFKQFLAGFTFLAYTSLRNEIDSSFNESFNVARAVDEAADLFSQVLQNGKSSPVQYGDWALQAAWDKTKEIVTVTATFGK